MIYFEHFAKYVKFSVIVTPNFEMFILYNSDSTLLLEYPIKYPKFFFKTRNYGLFYLIIFDIKHSTQVLFPNLFWEFFYINSE